MIVNPNRGVDMANIPIPKCKHCGEDTTHATESSFFGYVHRWGPTSWPYPHKFEVEEGVTP